MLRRLLGALAFSVMASTALAQDASPGALAQALIAQGNAAGVFEALPSEQLIAVRHGRSGLVCRLAPGNTNRLVIFPQAARGEDVACDTTDGAESATFYATRFSFETSLDELMRGAAQAIHQRFPDARELPAPTDAGATLPASRSAAFMVTRQDGATMYTRINVAMVGQWAIKLRYTVLAPDEDAARRGEAAAAALWNATLSELTQPRT